MHTLFSRQTLKEGTHNIFRRTHRVGTHNLKLFVYDLITRARHRGAFAPKNTQDGDAHYFQTNTQGGDAQYTNTISKKISGWHFYISTFLHFDMSKSPFNSLPLKHPRNIIGTGTSKSLYTIREACYIETFWLVFLTWASPRGAFAPKNQFNKIFII